MHELHEKLTDCEECGAPICLCLSMCESCRDRLDAEAGAEAQRYQDEGEAAAHLNGAWG